MTHPCPDCGLEHEAAVTVPEPAVVVDPGPNEHDVEIAAIEAEARVATEKIYAQERDQELQAEVERLRGEVTGMRDILDRLSPPEPDPEPVVVPVPAPAAAPEPEPAGPLPESKPPKAERKSRGYWG